MQILTDASGAELTIDADYNYGAGLFSNDRTKLLPNPLLPRFQHDLKSDLDNVEVVLYFHANVFLKGKV